MPRHEDRYMERSEKRSSYNRIPRKPVRSRKQPARGFVYGLLSIIVSLVVWPLGMVMLWPRRLRWSVGVKLIASMLTLVMCLCWIGFALTVQTDDHRITYVQDKVNSFLARSAEFVIGRADKLEDDVTYAAGEVGRYARENLPEAAGWTNGTVQNAKNAVLELVGMEPEAAPTAEPTEKPVAEPSDEPTDEPSAEPTDKPADEPSAEPTDKPTDEPTAVPTPTPEPVEVAEGSPAPARVTAEPRKLDAEADPTPAPTVKPAGEAVVYHSTNGKSYHEATNCVGMRGAGSHTFADSVADGFSACGNCNPPAEELLTETGTVLWLDELSVAHTSDECSNFSGRYTLAKLSDIADAAACPVCGASHYAPDLPAGEVTVTEAPTAEPTEEPTAEPTEEPTAEPTEEPTAESTEEPTAEPTEEPTAEPTEEPTAEPTEEPTAEPTEEPTVEPTAEPTEEPTVEPTAAPTIKPAGEATVYHTSNGVSYHMASRCIGMSNASPYTLAQSVADGYRACGNCDVPAASVLDAAEPVLWADASDIYHMSDECASFDGAWRLMTLTETGEAGMAPCAECGAEAYVYVVPTAEPTAEPTPVPENSELPHKSAGEAIVYHTSNGRSYHVAERCSTMSGAKPYTLAESIADGYGDCGICDVPDPDIVNYPVVWVDGTGTAHVSDECTYFEGRYTLMTIYDACGYNATGCPYCTCDAYIAAERARLMEQAKNVTVYYNDGSTYYHAASSCVNMPAAVEHNLFDALEKGLIHCHHCDPTDLSDLDAAE